MVQASKGYLTNDESIIISEIVFRDFKVERSWAFTDATGGVVVRTVAGAVVATKVSHVSYGHTA